MLIKICGMRETANIKEIANTKPDFMGFIFYPKSKRFVGPNFDINLVSSIMPKIQSTGVFVNEDFEKLLDTAHQYQFDYIQLHGNEPPVYCKNLRDEGFKIIKAVGIFPGFKWNTLESYISVCDYFLFDTNTKDYGGSGQKFNWAILSEYKYNKPFLLSGGIKPDDAEVILSIKHPNFAGIDINSGFEIKPGFKDPEKVKQFLNKLRTSKITNRNE